MKNVCRRVTQNAKRERERGQPSTRLEQKSLTMGAESTHDNLFKILIIGDSGVGKSRFLHG